MLQFEEYLNTVLEAKEPAERTGKTGLAIDEAALVHVANFANAQRRAGKSITAEALIKEINRAKTNKSHNLSFENADAEFFTKKLKISGKNSPSIDSWYGEMENAAYSLQPVFEHKDFQKLLNCKSGFRAIWFGKLHGNLASWWRKRNLKGATATSKTDFAFVSDCAKGIFTASLKDESGGALITSAGGETGAILETSVDDTLAEIYKLGSKKYKEEQAFLNLAINDIEELMRNDANSAEAQEGIDDLVAHFDDISKGIKDGDIVVPASEFFLRKIYIEALTARHKFDGDRRCIVTHLLRSAGINKPPEFTNVEEHLITMQKFNKNGFAVMLGRGGPGSDYGATRGGINVTLGKTGKRGAQPAIARVYPIKPEEQEQKWLHIQDNNIMNNNFAAYLNEFGYEISKPAAQRYWDKRQKVINAAIKAYNKTTTTTKGAKAKQEARKNYQLAVGYKATQADIEHHQEMVSEETPDPTDDYAGGGSERWLNKIERVVHRKKKSDTQTRASSQKAPQSRAKTEVKNRVQGAFLSAVQPKPRSKTLTAQPRTRQPAQAETKPKDKFDWSDIEKAYTTTHDSLEDIASRHNVSPEDVNDHVWSQRLRRPPKQRVAV